MTLGDSLHDSIYETLKGLYSYDYAYKYRNLYIEMTIEMLWVLHRLDGFCMIFNQKTQQFDENPECSKEKHINDFERMAADIVAEVEHDSAEP